MVVSVQRVQLSNYAASGAEERDALADQVGALRRALVPELLLQVVRGSVGLDLSLVQVATLYLLDGGARPTLRELAERIDRSESASSRLVDQLVGHGLVDRSEDARDRRVRRLDLTARGREVLRGIERTRASAQLELVAHLAPDERRIVTEAMALLATAARRQHDGRADNGQAGAAGGAA